MHSIYYEEHNRHYRLCLVLQFLLVFGTGRQCDICCFSIGAWNWPTVWYLLFFYWFLELADSVIFVVFLLVFRIGRQCDICCFSIGFWNWPTVWYLLFFYWFLELADSVIFVVFLLVFGTGRACDICFCFSFHYIILPATVVQPQILKSTAMKSKTSNTYTNNR
jgi:hypothetical protein